MSKHAKKCDKKLIKKNRKEDPDEVIDLPDEDDFDDIIEDDCQPISEEKPINPEEIIDTIINHHV